MSASSTTLSGLARKFTYIKRSGLLWFIGAVALMLVAHMSLARMQSINSWTLISENRLSLPPPENAHVCGEKCIETFIDEFIMADTNYEEGGAAKEASSLDDNKLDEEKDETEEGEFIMPTRGRDNTKNIYKQDTVREITWVRDATLLLFTVMRVNEI